MDGRGIEEERQGQGKVSAENELFIALSPLKALAIDEKIGYPEYLGDTNNTELERVYADVGHR